MSKTNIEFLRDIHKEIAEIAPTLAGEAEEFLDAIAEELESKTIVDGPKDTEDDDEDDDFDESDFDEKIAGNTDFVGLDTIHWGLEKGNLNVEMRMEAFIKQLQKENAVVPT